MKQRTLFWQLVFGFALVLLLGVAMRHLTLSYLSRSFFAAQLESKMREDARGVALWAKEHLKSAEQGGPVDLRRHLTWLHAVTEGRLLLVGPTGLVLADTGDGVNWRGTRLQHEALDGVLRGEVVSRRGLWIEGGITVGVPIIDGDRVVGAAFLLTQPARLEGVIAEFQPLVIFSDLAALVLAMLIAFWLSRSVARPIVQMRDFARRIGRREFDAHSGTTSTVVELRDLSIELGSAAVQLRRSFHELEEQKQRMQMLLAAMGEGVVAIDEEGRLLMINPAAGELLGIIEAPAGEHARDVGLPPELVEPLLEAVRDCARAVRESLFTCAGQELRAVISAVVPPGGRPAGAVAVLQDVTAEVRLRRMRENFVANVSHELRAPLTSLGAVLEAMNDGIIKPKDRARYLGLTLQEIGRMRRLVEDLLELSRLDAGIARMPAEEFDLAPLLRQSVETAAQRAAAHGIRLEVEAPALRVFSNRDRIAEVLANLLDNAIRFTPGGGLVRVAARAAPGEVRVSVSDTGAGIAEEHLPHIWDRFYKVDPARTRSATGGTGLGLSIVKQVVEALGGQVGVTSQDGLGSTFFFTIPTLNGHVGETNPTRLPSNG